MEELWDRQRRSTQIKRKIKVKIQKEKQMRENLALQEKENNLSTVSQKPEKLASESKELSLSQSSLSSKEELKRLNSKSTPKKSSDNSHRTVELVKSNIESEVPPQPNLDSVSKPKVLQSKTIERTGSVKSVSASQLDHMKKEIIEPERLNEEQTLSQTLQQQINGYFCLLFKIFILLSTIILINLCIHFLKTMFMFHLLKTINLKMSAVA